MFYYSIENAVGNSIAGNYRDNLYTFFVSRGITLRYKKNAVIEISGDTQSYVYLVKSGIVKQDFILENGTELTAMILSPGDLFGEVTYLHGDQNPISSIAHTDAELVQITSSEFTLILEQQPEIYKYLSCMLAYKVRVLLALVHDTSFCRVENRLANLLGRLAAQCGQPVPGGVRIAEIFTHQDLANMISTTRSTVTKLLKKMVADGDISIDRKHIILKP